MLSQPSRIRLSCNSAGNTSGVAWVLDTSREKCRNNRGVASRPLILKFFKVASGYFSDCLLKACPNFLYRRTWLFSDPLSAFGVQGDYFKIYSYECLIAIAWNIKVTTSLMKINLLRCKITRHTYFCIMRLWQKLILTLIRKLCFNILY